jgi:hypothetical protein
MGMIQPEAAKAFLDCLRVPVADKPLDGALPGAMKTRDG